MTGTSEVSPAGGSTGDRHHAPGRAAGVLIGFRSEDDWFDYRLEHDPGFLQRIADARAALRQGLGVPLEDLSD